jgi:putative DNA primase/helicase
MTRKKEDTPELAYTCGYGNVWQALERAGYQLSHDLHGRTYLAVARRLGLECVRAALDSRDAPLLVQQAVSAYARSNMPHGLHKNAIVRQGVLRDLVPALDADAHLLPQIAHPTRVAVGDRAVTIDLGWPELAVVELLRSGKGWRLHENAGIPFLRPRGMLGLPKPRRSAGVLERFRALAPLAAGDCDLLLAAMAYMLCAPNQHVMLTLFGLDGSGKTTLAGLVRDLTDPHDGRLLAIPEKPRDLVTAGAAMRLLPLDNLRTLDAELSDLLCKRLDGGVSVAYKANYTDAEMVTVHAEGPVVLTSITSLVDNPDLAGRGVFLRTELPDDAGRKQSEVDRELERLRPGLFAVVLDAAAAGLAGMEAQPSVPEFRRRDFAAFAQAAAPALRCSPELMRALLAEQVTRQRGIVADNAAVAAALISFARQQAAAMDGLKPNGPAWQGHSVTELLVQLTNANPAAVRDPNWPKTEGALRGHLARLRGVLAGEGVAVREERNHARKRTVKLFLSESGASMEQWSVGEVPDLEPPGGRLH